MRSDRWKLLLNSQIVSSVGVTSFTLSFSAKLLSSVMAGSAVSVTGLSTSCLNLCTVQLYLTHFPLE